jgi:hypothetical protein
MVVPDSDAVVQRSVASAGIRDVIPVCEMPEDAFRRVYETDRYAPASTAARPTGRVS